MSARRNPESVPTILPRPKSLPLVVRLPISHPPRQRSTGSPGSTVFSTADWDELARALRLSYREQQIVRGVFDDQTEFAIAVELGISPHTVHTYF